MRRSRSWSHCGWGAYGQGKTHLLTQLEHWALDQNFATSRIALSKGVSGAKWEDLYARLVENLRTPGSTQLGIQDLLNRKRPDDLADSPMYQRERYPHPLPSVVLETFFAAGPEDQELLYGDLAGERIPLSDLRRIYKQSRNQALPPFPERFSRKKHFTAYLGLMADTLKWLGYQGWVILLDELELVGRLGPQARIQAYLHLNWLLNWSQQMPYPIYTIGAAATTLENDVFESGRRDKYELVKSDKLYPEERQCLQGFFDRMTERKQSLQPLSPKEVQSVLTDIAAIYRIAWPEMSVFSDEVIFKAMDISGPLRTQIRALLECLDIERVYQVPAAIREGELMEDSLSEISDSAEGLE
ncbi:MAG: BREX system ATP-binding domain-containing protein [Pseudanabaenaceae cyanobacterium]